MNCEASATQILSAIQEANAKKKQLQATINSLLTEFTESTGLVISEVTVNRVDMYGGGSVYRTSLSISL
jgi:hypothetical protein